MMANALEEELIAPCGMHCALCSAYLAYRHRIPKKRGKISHCAGCRERNKQCAWLAGHCQTIAKRTITYCHLCDSFPCERLRHVDSRYRKQYGMSFIENLVMIRDHGIDAFFDHQKETYSCPKCGEYISIHSGKCYVCDTIESWRG
jgi:hypothetical protein